MIHKKIITYAALSLKHVQPNGKIVLVGGCFDVLHIGHIFFLEKARAAGDMLIVALESDEHILQIKKKKPIHSQEMRARILSHLDLIDYVIMLPLFNNSEDYKKMVELIQPSVIALTEGDPNLINKRNLAKQIHARIIEIKRIKTFSSSTIANYETFLSN